MKNAFLSYGKRGGDFLRIRVKVFWSRVRFSASISATETSGPFLRGRLFI